MADHPNPDRAPLVDTHSHLNDEHFDGNPEALVQRARQFGLIAMITVGIEPADWPATFAISAAYPEVFPAIGIHPNSADQTNDATLAEIERHCKSPEGKRVVGIGETGLDYYREFVLHEVQRDSFRQHLELARTLDLPVIIHDRDAHDDILNILREDGKGTRGVMHSFSGDLEMMAECIRLNYMISLSGPVTFRKAADKHEIARKVPLEWLLVETDCPYLTPEPYRGRRNEPAYVSYTARAISELRGTPLDKIAEATTANAQRLFNLPINVSADKISAGTGQGAEP